MNNAADAHHGASTGRETGAFLPLLGINLRDLSSAGDPIQAAVAPNPTNLVPVRRSDTSDPRTQYIIHAGSQTFLLWSLQDVWVHGLHVLGENTSTTTVGQFVNVLTSPHQSQTLDFEGAVADFYSTLVTNQEPLGKDFERVLYENLWDLYVRS